MTAILTEIRDGALEVLEVSPRNLLSYLSSTFNLALRQALRTRSREILNRHRLPDGSGTTVEVVHYTSVANLYDMIRSQIRWKQRPTGEAKPDSSAHYPHRREFDPATAPASQAGSDPSFRLYDSVHLNDPTEGLHLFSDLPGRYGWLKEFVAHHGYIGSFIPAEVAQRPENDLMFWRTYGRGGEGCSISLMVPHARLYNVSYCPQELHDTVAEVRPILDILIDPLLKPLQKLSRQEEESVLSSLSTAVWEGVGHIRYLYKNRSYAFERECRSVAVSSDIRENTDIHYCLDSDRSTTSLRHYVHGRDLQLAKIFASGTTVTVGPCVAYKEDVRCSIERLLRRAGLHTRVIVSRIPYRRNR